MAVARTSPRQTPVTAVGATTAFTRETAAARISFGPDRLLTVGEEARRLGAERALLICTGSAADAAGRAASVLGSLVAGQWPEVRSHVASDLGGRARAECSRLGADLLISIGGGAATGLAKAVALDLGIPILAVPTTYAGSEITTMWGITEGSHKTTGRSARVLPKTVIYDPLLTLGLPAELTAASGMNAIAHCVESLYAPGANPVATLLALEGLRRMAAALPQAVAAPADLDARSEALYAAYLAGLVMSEAGVGLHHKICHVLGGMYDLPHARLHAVMLPQAVAFIEARTPDALAPAAALLGGGPAAAALFDLALKLGAPTALSQLGVSLEAAVAAAPQVVAEAGLQDRSFTASDMADLLERAHAGQRPT
jgi:maleylacetate reductase